MDVTKHLKEKYKIKFDILDMLEKCEGKENKSMPHVNTGTGVHRNKKAYNRKEKHKRKIESV